MRTATRGAVAVAVLVASSGGLLAMGSACSSFDPNAVTTVTAPDYNQFKGVGSDAGIGVSLLLERRCGTLDCHGQVGRPLRIYGQYGLRFVDEAGNTSSDIGAATTETEHIANYQAVIGLQPELMSEVVQNTAPPTSLLLLRKPLQLERHKGGAVSVVRERRAVTRRRSAVARQRATRAALDLSAGPPGHAPP
jgi:hypothetical protein